MKLHVAAVDDYALCWLIGRFLPVEPRGFEPLTSAVQRRHDHIVIVRRCSEMRMVTPNLRSRVRDRSSAFASVTVTYLSSRRPVSAYRLLSSHEERFPNSFQWGELGTRSSKRDEFEPRTAFAPDDLTSRH